ncbi:MAG: peptidylprolyl isomerase [Rhodothalassiaceae bacterium]
MILCRFPRLIVSALAVAVLAAAPTVSQQADAPDEPLTNAIAVMVNDDPITLFDITQRERFVLATSGGVQTEEQLQVLRRRVIETLIDDMLKLQEARERDFLDGLPQEIFEQQFAQIANSFNFSAQQLSDYLARIGSSRETLITQIKAQFVWDQIINGLFGNRAAVGDEEVEDAMHRMEDSAGEFEYRLGEIQLLIPSPEEEPRIRTLATQLANSIRSGERTFSSAALQFSQSTSAASGGNLGWLSQGQMRREWVPAVAEAEVGSVTDPVRTPGAYVLLSVIDRRRILTADPLDARVELRQMLLRFTEQSTTEGVEAVVRQVAPRLDSLSSCSELPDLARETGFDSAAELGELTLRDLPAELRKRVAPLQPVSATKPILTGDALMVLVVCDRSEPEVRMPEFEDIQRQLEGERLAAFARRYLRDLKRDAVIDYRIPLDNL